MNKENILAFYAFLVFALFLVSMEMWIGWGHKPLLMSVLGVLTFLCGVSNNFYKFQKKYLIAVLILYLSYLFISVEFSLRNVFTQIPVLLIPVTCVLFVHDAYKRKILDLITKWYAILLIPSAVIFLITDIVHLPNLGVEYYNDNYGRFENYLFYLHNIAGGFRFNGPFLEPGHLGMIGAFLMMANNFKANKRYLVIILISIILSLSLAGYMLTLLGYLFCTYNEGKMKLGKMVLYVLILLSFITVVQTYNGGDNVINNTIVSRFDYDEERGIAGNNRASYSVMLLFEDVLDNRDLLLYGYDKEFQRLNKDMFTKSNGLVFFIVRHGIIGVFIVFSFYVFLAFTVDNRKYALLFLLFIFICFFQRTYYTWIPWILSYDYAIVNNGIGKKIMIKKIRK